MTREFLKGLGLEDSTIDRILDENMQDIGKEKRKSEAAETDLVAANKELTTVKAELEALKTSSGDAADLQKQLNDLKDKYATDTNALQAQLAERDYMDAIGKAIADKGLKFSSKSAEWAFTAALKEQKLELKDGKLTGLDAFIKAQQEADPDAFASDKPTPRIVTHTGPGGAPQPTVSRAAQLAAEHHASLYGGTKKE